MIYATTSSLQTTFDTMIQNELVTTTKQKNEEVGFDIQRNNKTSQKIFI